jgi:hypothetical protein
MLKMSSKSIHEMWYLLTPCLLIRQLIWLWSQEKTEEDPDDPESAYGDIQTEYSCN